MFQNYFKSSFSEISLTQKATEVQTAVKTALATAKYDTTSQNAGSLAAYNAIMAGKDQNEAYKIGELTAKATKFKTAIITSLTGQGYTLPAVTAGSLAAYNSIMSGQTTAAATAAALATALATINSFSAASTLAAGTAAGNSIMAGNNSLQAAAAGNAAAVAQQKIETDAANVISDAAAKVISDAAAAANVIAAKLAQSPVYYGNTKRVFNSPTIITLSGKIPVLNWRYGTEYKYNQCGCSSSCGNFTPNSDLAIESQTIGSTAYTEFLGNGNCAITGCGDWTNAWTKSENVAWCLQ